MDIPLRFFKVAVFIHEDGLAATGYVVDQTPQLAELPDVPRPGAIDDTPPLGPISGRRFSWLYQLGGGPSSPDRRAAGDVLHFVDQRQDVLQVRLSSSARRVHPTYCSLPSLVWSEPANASKGRRT